jgi:hypothetical protein
MYKSSYTKYNNPENTFKKVNIVCCLSIIVVEKREEYKKPCESKHSPVAVIELFLIIDVFLYCVSSILHVAYFFLPILIIAAYLLNKLYV